MPDTNPAQLLRAMLRIRIAEESLAELYRDEQEMRTPTHFSIGQEATPVGVSAALNRDDASYGSHRCHAPYLAKGGDLNAMVAELYGKENGCAHGRGGSVHLNDPRVGYLGSTAILGEAIALAVGSAWAFAMGGTSRVAAAFFGDGATEEGVFWECINFAVVRRVPVLFVCENNLDAMGTALARHQSQPDIRRKADAYGMPSEAVDGMDVLAVEEAAIRAAARVRRGDGPFLLELRTYRFRAHSTADPELYRGKEEVAEWKRRDPIALFTARLQEARLVSDADLAALETAVAGAIDEAVREAEAGPWEPVEDLTRDVYTETP